MTPEMPAPVRILQADGTCVLASAIPHAYPSHFSAVMAPVLGDKPIVLDLDGTLVWKDTLWQLNYRQAWQRWRCPARGIKKLFNLSTNSGTSRTGRDLPRHLVGPGGHNVSRKVHSLRKTLWSIFKTWITHTAHIDPAQWRYHADLVTLLHTWHAAGTPLYIATGACQVVADAVAHHLGCFQEAWGTTPFHHLVGPTKAAFLQNRLGPKGFHYVGDSWQDRFVWQSCDQCLCVAPPNSAIGRWLRGANGRPNDSWFIPWHITAGSA